MRTVAFAIALQLLALPGQADDKEGTRPLVLAHYMPWYSAEPGSNRWGWHWTMNHFDPNVEVEGRRQIASRFYPLIGPYDSGDPDVLEYHLLLMRLAGIDGVIVDWYGLTDFRDYALLHRNTTRMLQQCERLHMKFVICYEDQTIPARVAGNRLQDANRVSHATGEIEWLNKYWFQSPAYVRLDGQPVLLSFGHTGLTNDEWKQLLTSLDVPIMYFSQDFRRNSARGGFGWPAPQIGLQHSEKFLAAAKAWPDAIPAAFPRFQDIYRAAQVSDGYPEIVDNEGETFRLTLAMAIQSRARIVQLATWNDWGEGTQIEPSREFGFRDLQHLQALLRLQKGLDHSVTPEDLRIPQRIFQMRQTQPALSRELDEVVSQLTTQEFAAARQRLQAIDSSVPVE